MQGQGRAASWGWLAEVALPNDYGGALTTHRLRVTLLDVSPPVWRELRVPSAVPLSVLHPIIQLAMGWEDRHLHEWRVGESYYGPAGAAGAGADLLDEAGVLLSEVAPADSVLTYSYDLGDGWEHLIEVLSVDAYDGRVPPLAVLAGERSCPPEDVGGPQGYADLLAALANPSDLDHDDAVLAYGDTLDPGVFDREQVSRRLEALWRVDAGR